MFCHLLEKYVYSGGLEKREEKMYAYLRILNPLRLAKCTVGKNLRSLDLSSMSHLMAPSLNDLSKFARKNITALAFRKPILDLGNNLLSGESEVFIRLRSWQALTESVR